LLVLLLFLRGLAFGANDQAAEPDKFFRECVGLNDGQIAAIRKGRLIAKILESRTANEVFVFGSVSIESTPEKYLKFASEIDALRKLPSYLAILTCHQTQGHRSDANDPLFRDFVAWIKRGNRKIEQLYGWPDAVVDWESIDRCGGCGPRHEDG
jgi:hypothetical protein